MSTVDRSPEDVLVHRIATEFDECPALRVTVSQAARLWALPVDRASTILLSLVETGRLVRTARGEFIRRDRCARCA
jgi:hypothetical protein